MYTSKSFHKWSIFQLAAGLQMLVLAGIIGFAAYNKLTSNEDMVFAFSFLLIFAPLVYYFLKTPLKISFANGKMFIKQPFIFKKSEVDFTELKGYSYGITQTKYYELHTVVLYLKSGEIIEVNNRMIDKYERFLDQLTAEDDIEYLGFEKETFSIKSPKKSYSFQDSSFEPVSYKTKEIRSELITANNGFATSLAALMAIMGLTFTVTYFMLY
ncbi:hypothetical protein [Aureibacter tunicatorum]|uniref:Uncharacterized protein n=1 Tax=Aureibacter tunicatorum TaxID=866807 RepID=A0AAE3XK01_9BACT|nr:hypothetical protein [Aureibacter tunicatorum]MDR6237345.1 hypothetical protein [Aureibacter tunicatorum]BDD06336.1 hypothetical protein AUTU_38190 [Aureibacter tunicatorum]